MYYNHQLRTNLQEWKNRLYKCDIIDAKDDFSYFYENLIKNSILCSLIDEIKVKYIITEEEIVAWLRQINKDKYEYDGFEHKLFYLINCVQYFYRKKANPLLCSWLGGDSDKRREAFFNRIIEPIVNYLHDSLDEVNFILYILEKYKLRTEWFLKNDLKIKYYDPKNKQHENILENDIRLYLFDQGIDYPFSTPLSSSGRADVISLIDTDNPLVMEIKIYDSNKGYRQDRIKKGFAQIVNYSNDYNKNVGYLVIFNLDNVEIEIENNTQDKNWPNRFFFNNKTYYIIIINLNNDISASKQKIINKISISYEELISTEE